MKIKIKMTITASYEYAPEYYPPGTIEEHMKWDAEQLRSEPIILLDMDDSVVEVEALVDNAAAQREFVEAYKGDQS
jgi:hypothetical protein